MAKQPPAEPTKLRSRRADLALLVAAIATILGAGAFAAHRLNVVKAESTQLGEEAGIADRSAQRADEFGARVSAQPTPLSDLTARAVAEMQAAAAAATPAAKADAPKRANTRQRAVPIDVPPPVELAPAAQAVAVAPVVAPAVEAPEAPQPDRWQLMNESIAHCSGDLIDRILCDQRVRRQFCDGHWGQVPQCSSSIINDHGG